jgi:hypothetical protein
MDDGDFLSLHAFNILSQRFSRVFQVNRFHRS